MTQYGFFIDTSRCTGCNACTVSCKQYRNIAPGPAKPIRVYQWETGAFPNIDVRVLPIMCFHCAEPRCLAACEHGAIYKEETHGAVLVDAEKCAGDRNCYEACPYGTPQFLSDAPGEKMLKCDMCIERLAEGKAPLCVLSCSLRALDFGPLDELREKYGDRGCYIAKDAPPCRAACPAGVDIERYMALAAEGRYDEALAVVREKTALAAVLGRVCTHPCEIDCFRGRFDDALAVREVKRFLADRVQTPLPAPAAETGRRVAVVGSGPAGLSCAYALRRRGHGVTVFERDALPGGMMRYGIPAYRLPKDVLDREIAALSALGICFETNHPVPDLAELAAFDAVFVAAGADTGARIRAEGGDSRGIETALEFLRRVNAGEAEPIGVPVVVVGGGSVAMDAARSALRLGAPEVRLVCPERENAAVGEQMPAQDDELAEARAEGVLFHDGHGVTRFTAEDGAVTGVDCVRCLHVRDAEGRYAPEYAPEVSLHLPAGLVLLAIGQRTGTLPAGLPRTERGEVAMGSVYQTADPRVFAGGDMLTGTTNIITCVAVGNAAAESIDRYFRGEAVERPYTPPDRAVRRHIEKRSAPAPLRPAAERVRDFGEVSTGYTEPRCREQSARCLHCGEMCPSAVIRREQPKRMIVPWDAREALSLWAKRRPDSGEALPDVIESIDEVLDPANANGFFRNRLVLKPKTAEEKLLYTMDDE